MSAGQRPRGRSALNVPADEAMRVLRIGAVGLAAVLLAVLAVSVAFGGSDISPHSSPRTLLADADPLASAAREEKAMNAATDASSGFAKGKVPRDRDISLLVLDDHASFRRAFAYLDEVEGEIVIEAKKNNSSNSDDVREITPTEEQAAKLSKIWDQLALHLEIHADAEEKLLYPTLVRKGGKDAGDETEDAIGDHNKIRDAIVASKKQKVGSAEWWKSVGKARSENTEHLGEEEDEALPDFRRHTSKARREELGDKWIDFYRKHPKGEGLDLTHDSDPKEFVKKYEQKKSE